MINRDEKFDKISLKFILIGFIFSQKITLIGQIYILEIFSILYLILNIRTIKFNPLLKKLSLVLFFHLIVVIYSDFINQSPFDLFLKGFLSLPFFFITILFLLTYFNQKYFLFVNFLIGFLIGDNFINNFINNYNPFFFGNPIKWGGGLLILSLIFLYDEFDKTKISLAKSLIFTFLLIIISLISGARALPLTIFFAQILLILTFKTNLLEIFNSKKTFFLFSLIIFLSTIALGLLPGKINSVKYFTDINKKNISQNQGTFGVVVAARSEWIAIYHAFKDKPLFGHGSYPADKNYYYTSKIGEFLYDNNYIDIIPNYHSLFEMTLRSFTMRMEKQIPTHSFYGFHLICYGFFGSLFMIFLLYFITKTYLNHCRYLNFYFHFHFITFIYNFYFSPWGAAHRVPIALFFVILILKSDLLSKNKNLKS
jgi:hypothetical protein